MLSWTRRPDHAFGLMTYLLFIGAVASAMAGPIRSGATSLGERIGLWIFMSAITLCLAMVFAGFRRRRDVRSAFAIAGTVVLGYGFVNAVHVRLFHHHPSSADARIAIDALATGTVPIEFADKVFVGIAFLAALAILWHLLAALSFLPRSRWLDQNETYCVRWFLGFCGTVLFFHDLFFVPYRFPGNLFAFHRPDVSAAMQEPSSANEVPPYDKLFERQFQHLLDVRSRFPLDARVREKPDILFIHVESLRGSDFQAELFPKTLAQAQSCFRAPRHYSTGNATGNGLHGVLTGLSAGYAPVTRRNAFAPLPFQLLRQFGYAIHVWYPNQALDFDGLKTDVIGNDVEFHRLQGLPVHDTDARTVSSYLATSSSDAPRFDYVVIDSTHYDYSYPEEFEVHRPAGVLGLHVNPLSAVTLADLAALAELNFTADDKIKIRNRYKNSLLYVDSLIARLLASFHDNASKPKIVAMFGDHGEAFWDRDDAFGHSINLSDAQIRVPFVFCAPRALRSSYAVTSHADIFPTVFDAMGVTSSMPFMTGKSLYRYESSRDFAIARGLVNTNDASSHFRLIEPKLSTEFMLTSSPRVKSMQTDGEQDVPLSPMGVAHATATFVGGSTFHTPAALSLQP